MSDEKPSERKPLPGTKARMPFEMPKAPGASMKQGALLVYGVLVVALLGVAAYMAVVENMPLTSPWVAAPSIGSLWFVLRLFMVWGSRG